ncbi:hypothetical protein POM88_040604 [Heracleum sosnowskyi]|uniref:GDP-Man:Man(3)GlcNAc(2)-PP-Dol alpha-1,2-mannosyltransferase n=1 Tax=Heracleum sosnowskyi TaxID=360622 RepID=A0AAD8MAI5_9APIA|nr:hypothetical protein POM88_040604 [Heracleum sosnowskyi]
MICKFSWQYHPKDYMKGGIIVATFIVILTPIVKLFFTIKKCRRQRKNAVAFFHPYTNDCGGGERVLWCAVKGIQELFPDLECVVYTGDQDASPENLTALAIERFGVALLHPPKVVHLYKTKWIEDTTFPRFKMMGKSFGSVYLSWEALCKLVPIYYFDTSGYAFTYPVARIFGCKVICYTHCPTISLDKLSRVEAGTTKSVVAKSVLLSRFKVIYYKFFSWLYGIVGSYAHLVMVNSSWTRAHINKLWGSPERIFRVYPPCHTSGLQVLPLERPAIPPKFISLAQFRPEKAHSLKLEAFALAIKSLDSTLAKPILQFVGTCRNEADEMRLQKLKDQAIELNVDDYVEFYKDITYRDLVQLLGAAIAGLHAMTDEHFGINVVEYMAAGAIPIAHNSAGPKTDIISIEDGKQVGFLAQHVEEYTDAMLQILRMTESERLEMADAARQRASRFSEQRFYRHYKIVIQRIICHPKK